MNTKILKSGQQSFLQGRILVWFSCGAASAVAAKLAVEKYGGKEPLEILYHEVANEHPDNQRFRKDVEKWIDAPILACNSTEYPSMDIYDVFRKERYIKGVYGASCTRALKREVGHAYAHEEDIEIFGFTADEKNRIQEFEANNPFREVEWILRDQGITKVDCYRLIQEAGIMLPAMYLLGYQNNNCIGCVKGGAGYWNKIRRDFPAHFERMARLTREMGVTLIKVKGERIHLDELPPDAGRYDDEPPMSCGPQCVMPDQDLLKQITAICPRCRNRGFYHDNDADGYRGHGNNKVRCDCAAGDPDNDN